jgi:glycosyltransferase involved in cell wall biosynthesis
MNLVTRVKDRLRRYRAYYIASDLRRSIQRTSGVGKVIALKPRGSSRGNVLLSYSLSPFLRGNQTVPHSHIRFWECREIGQIFLNLGYSVDVMNNRDWIFTPQHDYSYFIDVRWNLQRLGPLINKDCIKIMHIDNCHTSFDNAAESARLLALQQRKGITLLPRRYQPPNLAIEHADCATILGNEFTISTFKYAKKPLYPVPLASTVLFPWQENKNFKACSRRFLWFGNGGLVRKGLDLVLEAFAEMPDYHLTVCGPIKNEADFDAAYHRELYETPNIDTIGWVDTLSPQFMEITRQCVGLVFASAAEGQCGGVITCLHAGLVPIISYESGVDVNDFGVILRTCSIDEIKSSVRAISNLPAQTLQAMARKAWEYAREHHTKEKFTEEYRKVIEKLESNRKTSRSQLEVT